jgi:DNA-directed RNA polymerase subunit E'/Rpb7
MSSTFQLSKEEKKSTSNSKHLYYKIISQKKVYVRFQETSNNIENTLLRKLKELFEGKCNSDGFVKPESIQILSYSNGECFKNTLLFTISFSCMVCKPVEGMKLHVKAINITKAGIRAKLNDDQYSPLDIFVARDHNINHTQYQAIQENTDFMVEVIGCRYELNDRTISVIAVIADEKYLMDKPTLTLKTNEILDLDEIIME